MAFYTDESQLYKCQKHPSRRRVSGICPKCLRERLVTLCPDCATARPCHCSPPPPDTSSTSSSTSSSSFSLFSFSRTTSRRDSVTVNVDPTLRKSRSVAVSFLRSRSKHVGCDNNNNDNNNNNNNKGLLPKVSRSKINFWSVFTVNKNKKCDMHVDSSGVDEGLNKCDDVDNNNPVMMRSRSVAVGNGNGYAQAMSRQKGWYFRSPIRRLRHAKPLSSVAVA